MIVNVNPYETGFDENSHVMKFSAVAKGVMTVKRGPDAVVAAAPVPVPAQLKHPTEVKKNAEQRIVRLSLVEGGEEEEIIYEGALHRQCPGALHADAESTYRGRRVRR